MTTLRATIEAEIETITQRASTDIATLRAKLVADEPAAIAFLETEVEKVEELFHRFAAHFKAAPTA